MDSNKKVKNRSYYERNRERILERARQRALGNDSQPGGSEASVVSIFQKPESHPKPKVSKKVAPRRGALPIKWESIFLMAMVGLMTGYLFHETAKFFFVSDSSWGPAVAKAAILEGAAIAFTLMQARTFGGSLFNRLMVVLIYSFGVWVVSYPIVSGAQSQQMHAEVQQKTIQELETEISKKQAIRDQYWKQDRVTFARKYDVALDALRVRLESERKRSTEVPKAQLVQGVLLAGILFRVLVMTSNFACIQYLRRFRSHPF